MKKLLSILLVVVFVLSACQVNPQSTTTTTTNNSTTTTDSQTSSCPHVWETVTTAPTCTSVGYDTMTCPLCDKTVRVNETPKLNHTYSTNYSFDDNYHWFACTGCGDVKDKEAHTPDADGICTVCKIPTISTPGVIYDVSADGTYVEVIGYTGTSSVVKIVSEYQGLPVKGIVVNVFANRSDLTHVIIPEGVTSIGESCFCGSSNMMITIPSTLENIGDCAFMACDNMSINVTDIGYWCNRKFSYMGMSYDLYVNGTLITNLVIPNYVTTLSDYAFGNCKSLISVTVSDSVTSMGNSSFADCNNLISVHLGNGMTEIPFEAFKFCSKLESITIPEGYTTIGKSAFYYCSSLTSITLPSTLKKIESGVFALCNNLTFNEFDNCAYLGNANNPYMALIYPTNTMYSSYTLHSDTEVIAVHAFDSCARLGNIVIPKSVVYIDLVTFRACSNLQNIYYTGSEEEWAKLGLTSYDISYATVHYNYVP